MDLLGRVGNGTGHRPAGKRGRCSNRDVRRVRFNPFGMSTHHHPVLLWSDASGAHTAALLGDWPDAAHGETAGDVLQQLKELLEWRVVHEPWTVSADLTGAALNEFKVEVRPQYKSEDGRRILPCPETLSMRVPCVTGRQENGLLVCVVPHLGLRFNYEDARTLRSLVGHFVGDALQGRTPLELAALLPPANPFLAEVTVREVTRTRRVPVLEREEFKPLLAVADSLLAERPRSGVGAAYGREELAARLARQLGHERGNLLLVGEPGVGKSTLLLDAVRRVARERPASGQSGDADGDGDGGTTARAHRFWRGSGSRMIAGMRYLGEWEERCEEFIKALGRIEGVLCVERLLELVRVGGEGPGNSVAAFLLPYLQRGELRMVAEASPEELEACRRLFPALLDVFQVVLVPAFEETAARDALARVAAAHAPTVRVDFPPALVAGVLHLFRRFLPYATLPGPAAEFVRQLITEVGRRPVATAGPRLATPSDVLGAFVRLTGLPERLLRDEVPLSGEEVRAEFARQIIGQPAAVDVAARVVTTLKAGLTDPQRPAAVLLFCGPTGVGKTALAQALATYCFGAAGAKDRLVRLDLSEYSGPGAAHRLLNGAGSEPAAWLQRVRAQPFCVLLLDEVEKAAPEIFDILLAVLDEGRLTDRFGRVTNLRSALIVMTSNLGSTSGASMGFTGDIGPDYDAEVQRFFRPEFFNRLDGVVTFRSLTPEDVRSIVRKELEELGSREGLADAGLKLAWDASLEEAVAKAGYDQRLGARPLQRALERMVVAPLARWRVDHPGIRSATLQLRLSAEGRLEVVVDGV